MQLIGMTISGRFFRTFTHLVFFCSKIKILLFEILNEPRIRFDINRVLFPKVTVSKIEEFGKTYCGSEEEKNDIIKYYIQYKGDFGSIMENVMLAEEGDYERIASVIRNLFETAELTKYMERFESTYDRVTAKAAKKSKTSSSKSASKRNEEADDSLLQQMILNNSRRGGSTIASIIDKYSRAEDVTEKSVKASKSRGRKKQKL